MAISIEYQRKLKCLIDLMLKRSYHSLGKIELSGFFTYDKLTFAQATARPREKFSEGQPWGKKWEYGWFFGEVTLPNTALNEEICFKLPLGEGVTFVNGRVIGAFDKKHDIKRLSDSGVPGERYKIAAEVYAGHDGPSPAIDRTHAVFMLPELNIREFPDNVTQKTYRHGSFGIYYGDVEALHTDLQVLLELRNGIDGESLRAASIDKGLKKVCDVVDVEAPFDAFTEQVKIAREILRPLFECKNGSSAPTAFAVGNSHLDLEWLWTTAETERKCARTVGNQLELIKRYPEYKYLQTQAWIFDALKRNYPELYAELKEAVKNGNVTAEGGMWVQADTLIPSGESLIRQFAFGKRFIAEEFGSESEIFWLPDSFGVSGSLPQIMKGCGIKYFMNAKIQWAYNGGDIFPHNAFRWQGIDGSEILTNVVQGYALNPTPSTIIKKWNENAEKEDVPIKLIPFGFGDGGGGATEKQLEYLRREQDLEGMPKVKTSTPNEFFDALSGYDVKKRYVGELYYPCHRGTYTSQAKTKLLNRRSEFALRDAEAATALFGRDFTEKLNALWKTVLFNQFHDIIPGSSISAVYEIAEKEYEEVIAEANKITENSLGSVISPSDEYITVFNSLAWKRDAFIPLPEKDTVLYTREGERIPTEIYGDTAFALVRLPSFGTDCFRVAKEAPNAAVSVKTDAPVLENDLIRVKFNEKGELISAVDLESGTEYLSAPSNVFRMYRDMPTFSDAWDIDSFYESLEEPLSDTAVIENVTRGSLISSVTFTRKLKNSFLRQTAVLKKGARSVEFKTEVEWNETHKLLKTDFHTNIHTDNLLSEIQFGNIKRPNHKNRAYDADRFEVFQHKWSALCESGRYAALLNDCKYGISADGGKMSLTLLKSAMDPALNADKGRHVFTYSFIFADGNISDGRLIKAAYELNCPVTALKGCGERKSFIGISADNVVVETVKPASDGSGDTVIRLYEAAGTLTSCTLTLGFDAEYVTLTDMLEKNGVSLDLTENGVRLTLKAFKVVTLRIKRKD